MEDILAGKYGVADSLLVFIKVIQMIMVPLFGIMTLIGIFLFIFSFKNPMKRRAAFLFTVISPIAFLGFLHGILFVVRFVVTAPVANEEGQGVEVMVSWVERLGAPIYHVFEIILQPVLAILFCIGLGVSYLAAKNPGRKRLGTGILIGVPFLWGIVLLGPTIYHIFIS
ncbi:hypothetical protein MHH81_20680 [Psychrobacillus sp. FSL H8-0484]|uniref:hypothetical protein n=1 Tax=Psychrobacillus sp. FSL H8-0484 TaxID=2921390 RepID=UPI0030F77E70